MGQAGWHLTEQLLLDTVGTPFNSVFQTISHLGREYYPNCLNTCLCTLLGHSVSLLTLPLAVSV